MLRDLPRLLRAAVLVTDDLNRTLGSGWHCEITTDYMLTLSGPNGVESSALSPEIEDEAWFVRPLARVKEQEAGLDADAEEAVAQEVLEVLDVLGVVWPICREHESRVQVCEGVWYCPGRPEHDHALLGHLKS